MRGELAGQFLYEFPLKLRCPSQLYPGISVAFFHSPRFEEVFSASNTINHPLPPATQFDDEL